VSRCLCYSVLQRFVCEPHVDVPFAECGLLATEFSRKHDLWSLYCIR